MKKMRLLGIVFFVGILFIGGNAARANEATSTEHALIHLKIAADQTLFDSDIDVQACSLSPTSSSTYTVNIYCAIQQSGLANDFSWSGDDVFLNSLGGHTNDYGNNIYWSWFSNWDYGQTAVNKHVLTSGESILLTFGLPLKIELDSGTTTVSTSTMVVKQFGFDSNWNPIWSIINDANFHIDGLRIFAGKIGFISSQTITLSSVGEISSPATNTNSSVLATQASQNDQTGSQLNSSTALAYLISKQHADGSFGSDMYTDWAALALASAPHGSAYEKIKNYLQNSNPSLSSATDYERHAMALMSYGINPYSGTGVDYIAKIKSAFDGNQIGDVGLVNDDIFAIFPLIKAGISANDPIIQKTVQFILSKQASDGSWNDSLDVTSAAIQALSMVSSIDGVSSALTNAKTFIQAAKQAGNSFSVSWASQATVALGDDSSSFLSHLATFQQTDGGFESLISPEDTRVWATAYAIPAIYQKKWFSLMSSFSAPTAAQNNNAPAAPQQENIQDATTSQPVVADFVAPSLKEIMELSPLATAEEDKIKDNDLAEGEKTDVVSPLVAEAVSNSATGGNGKTQAIIAAFAIIALSGVAYGYKKLKSNA